MRCSVCGEEVSARADFCAGCGAQLAAVTGDLSSLPDAAPTAAPPARDTVTAAATSPLTTSSAATGSETPTSATPTPGSGRDTRSEEHTSELQSLRHLVCRLLLEKKKTEHS